MEAPWREGICCCMLSEPFYAFISFQMILTFHCKCKNIHEFNQTTKQGRVVSKTKNRRWRSPFPSTARESWRCRDTTDGECIDSDRRSGTSLGTNLQSFFSCGLVVLGLLFVDLWSEVFCNHCKTRRLLSAQCSHSEYNGIIGYLLLKDGVRAVAILLFLAPSWQCIWSPRLGEQYNCDSITGDHKWWHIEVPVGMAFIEEAAIQNDPGRLALRAPASADFFSCIAERARDIVGQQLEIRKESSEQTCKK